MKEILENGFAELNIASSDDQISKLIRYSELLVEWNEKINLTAICDERGIAEKHFLDSSTALLTGFVNGKVIDVGTGAGFPGFVLKIKKPEIELTLLDSLQKRINFLKTVGDDISVDATYIHSRAEDGGRMYREKYDTVVSRAVANMTVLSELCLPFLKVGGYFLALKGRLADEELSDAKKAIHILGGEVTDIFSAKIPGTDLNHKIIIVKKVRPTPTQFPRKGKKATEIPVEKVYKKK